METPLIKIFAVDCPLVAEALMVIGPVALEGIKKFLV